METTRNEDETVSGGAAFAAYANAVATVFENAGGDRDQLILDHLTTVRTVARHIHHTLPQHVELEELVSAGTVGLIDAAARFDASRNVQFGAYARRRIHGAILDSLRAMDWSPRELRRKARQVEDAIHTLTGRLGRMPGDEEIAEEIGESLANYHHLLDELKGLQIGALNATHNENTGEEEIAYLADPSEEDPLFHCQRSEMHAGLTAAIDRLSERESLVLKLYYYEELPMKSVATVLNLSEARIWQIRSTAVLKLRTMMRSFGESQDAMLAERVR